MVSNKPIIVPILIRRASSINGTTVKSKKSLKSIINPN
jgi:hypothetical protein